MKVTSRAATLSDLDVVTRVMTTAFATDPVWGGWAFPDPDRDAANEQRRRFWEFCLRSGMRYPWLRMTDAGEAVALWFPPDSTELTHEEEGQLEPLLRELVGGHAGAFLEGLELFEASHPRVEPHYYLSLLGTHDEYRGKGIGMALLRENLELVDAKRLPAYLESTNDVNLGRYVSVGFERYGEFTLPAGGPTVTTMWRIAR